jgi:alpha-galactosidase
MTGLDPMRDYRIIETGQIYGGDELIGINLPHLHGDSKSVIYRLQSV